MVDNSLAVVEGECDTSGPPQLPLASKHTPFFRPRELVILALRHEATRQRRPVRHILDSVVKVRPSPLCLVVNDEFTRHYRECSLVVGARLPHCLPSRWRGRHLFRGKNLRDAMSDLRPTKASIRKHAIRTQLSPLHPSTFLRPGPLFCCPFPDCHNPSFSLEAKFERIDASDYSKMRDSPRGHCPNRPQSLPHRRCAPLGVPWAHTQTESACPRARRSARSPSQKVGRMNEGKW